MRRWLALMVVVTACGGTGQTATTITLAPFSTPTAVDLVVPRQLEELDVTALDVGGRRLVLAVADTPLERATGLMFITELDDLDGMLFVYRSDTDTPFHMENTLIPLDIAFFTADGELVSKTTMEPCVSDDCPDYRAEGRYRYAIEVPAGEFDRLDASSRLDVVPPAD